MSTNESSFKRVLEFKLHNGRRTIKAQRGRVLSVAYNDVVGHVVVLILAEVNSVSDTYTFAVVGTKENLPNLTPTEKYAGSKWKYINSVQPSGRSILHVFHLVCGVSDSLPYDYL